MADYYSYPNKKEKVVLMDKYLVRCQGSDTKMMSTPRMPRNTTSKYWNQDL